MYSSQDKNRNRFREDSDKWSEANDSYLRHEFLCFSFYNIYKEDTLCFVAPQRLARSTVTFKHIKELIDRIWPCAEEGPDLNQALTGCFTIEPPGINLPLLLSLQEHATGWFSVLSLTAEFPIIKILRNIGKYFMKGNSMNITFYHQILR